MSEADILADLAYGLNEAPQHLCQSLTDMKTFCKSRGEPGSYSYVPIMSKDLYSMGCYFEKACVLISYLKERLENAEVRAQAMNESYMQEFRQRLAVEKERDCYKYEQGERRGRDGF